MFVSRHHFFLTNYWESGVYIRGGHSLIRPDSLQNSKLKKFNRFNSVRFLNKMPKRIGLTRTSLYPVQFPVGFFFFFSIFRELSQTEFLKIFKFANSQLAQFPTNHPKLNLANIKFKITILQDLPRGRTSPSLSLSLASQPSPSSPTLGFSFEPA